MAVELQNEKAFQKQFGVFAGKQRLLGKSDGKENRYFKDIGLGYKIPKAAIEGTYVDHKCPFTSSVSIRGRVLTGIVKSTKMQRTIIVRRDYLHFVPKYSRYEKRHKNIPAHCSPCFNVKEGDRVVIGQCRPLSKTVRFNVIKVVDTKKKNVSTRRARRIAQIRKGIARGTYQRKRVSKAVKGQKVVAAKKVHKKVRKTQVVSEERIKKLAEKELKKKAKKEMPKESKVKGKKQADKGKKQTPGKQTEKKAGQAVEKKEGPKKSEVKKEAGVKKEQQAKKTAPAKKEQQAKKTEPAKKEQQAKKTAPAKKEQRKKAAAKAQAKVTKK